MTKAWILTIISLVLNSILSSFSAIQILLALFDIFFIDPQRIDPEGSAYMLICWIAPFCLFLVFPSVIVRIILNQIVKKKGPITTGKFKKLYKFSSFLSKFGLSAVLLLIIILALEMSGLFDIFHPK